MSLTHHESDLHKAYASLDDLARSTTDLPGRLKIATDKAFEAAKEAIEDQCFKTDKCDMAEALVAHIFEYICKSNKIDPAVFKPFEN